MARRIPKSYGAAEWGANFMISYTEGSRRFNYRIAAVFVDDGHLLVHRAESDPFWALPGGRAEMCELAAETVRREMREELGEDVRVDRLLWVVESFFLYTGLDYHELGLYWLAHLPATSPRRTKQDFHGIDAGTPLVFRWVPLADVPALDLRPNFLRTAVGALPAGVEHVVVSE
jgi:ADP-ribose pyrophosphatase YjhB (NUDIX family)